MSFVHLLLERPAIRRISWSFPASAAVMAALAAVGVYLAAKVGYAFTLHSSGTVIVWPPAGLLLALLILVPGRHWPLMIVAAVAGHVAADLAHGLRLPIALAGSGANVAGAIAAAWVMCRIAPDVARMATLRHLAALGIGGVIVTNAVTSMAGGLVLSGAAGTSFARGWLMSFTSAGIGMLIVTPAVLALVAACRAPWPSPRRLAEAAALVAALTAAAAVLIGPLEPRWFSRVDAYALMPLLFWIAYRLGPPGVAVAMLAVTSITLWFTAQGQGPLVTAAHTQTDTIVHLYLFLALASVSALAAAILMAERRAALVGLAANNTRFRRIAETIDDVLWVADLDLRRIDYISPAFERIWGHAPSRAYDDPRILQNAIHPDDRERVRATLRRLEAFDIEYRIVRPDGEVRWIADRGRPVFDETGHPIQFVGVARDKTERRRTEARTRLLVDALESTNDMVVVTDLDERITFANRAFLNTLGYDVEEVLGRPAPASLIPPDTRVVQSMKRGVALGGWEGDITATRKDGTTFPARARLSAIRDAEGRMTGVLTTGADVSEQRSLEAQLQQAQKMEAIGQLAGGIAHDFNNLLTAILGYANFLRESTPPGDERRHDVDEIVKAGERAARLTQQLLAFSRRQVLEPTELRLGAVIGNLAPMLRRLLGETIDLQAIIGDAATIRADAGQLEQILMNLAVNARDAMGAGGKLTIETSDVWLDLDYARTHRGVETGPYVCLSVTDTGHGMDEATRARIFEPFFTTKPVGQGTGLGLAMVHGIVKQTGGHIWVYSEPGHGTSFKLYLPRVGASAEPVAAAPGAAEPSAVSADNAMILLVEDNRAVRDFVAATLERRGYQVRAFDDPAVALRFVETHEGAIDALITDVVLPGMHGVDLADRVRRLRRDAQVLLMSGYSDGALTHQRLLEPGTAFLQKPFSGAALLQEVRELLDVAS